MGEDIFLDVKCLWTTAHDKFILILIFKWCTQERARLQTTDGNELAVIELKLAWIVHIIAAILKIKQCTGCR